MTVLSGKYAVVNGIDTMRNVSIDEQSTPARAVASNTRQGVVRRHGIRSWSGTANRFGGMPILMPGDFFAFAAHLAPDSSVEGTVGPRYDGNAVVSQLQHNWSWQDGQMQSQQYTFAGHLALTPSDNGVALTDVTTPDIKEVCGTKIQYQESSGGAWTQVPALLTAQLMLSVAISPYVNSDTECWTGQMAGAPVDWTVSLTQQDMRRGLQFDVPDDIGLRMFIDDVLYWELLWGHVVSIGGITADRETGAILQRTINIAMDAMSGIALGHVLLPNVGNTEWWPTDARP